VPASTHPSDLEHYLLRLLPFVERVPFRTKWVLSVKEKLTACMCFSFAGSMTFPLLTQLPVMQPGTKHHGNLPKPLQALDLMREERNLRNRQLIIPLPQLTEMILLLCGLLREEG